MSALKIVRILVALKATVDRNVNSLCWQDFVALKALVDKNVNSHCWQHVNMGGGGGGGDGWKFWYAFLEKVPFLATIKHWPKFLDM